MSGHRNLRHLGLFEAFKEKNITVGEEVSCIDAGVVESLNVSFDLHNVIKSVADSGDKVAQVLVGLLHSDAYPDDEDLNFLDLSREFNKFSFVPKKRRSKSEDIFDRESMPTRIGKIVRKVFKAVEDKLTFRQKGQFMLEKSEIQPEEGSRTYLYGREITMKPGWARYEIGIGEVLFVPVGNVEMHLNVDGDDIEAEFVANVFYFEQDDTGWRKAYKISFNSPHRLDDGPIERKVKVELKSDFSMSDSDIEDFVNKIVGYLKANSSGEDTATEIVNGEDIRFWYDRRNYQNTVGELGNSCMSYQECQWFLDMYCMNQDKVSMVILRTKEHKLIGRALLWSLDNGRKFLDRVYSILDSDSVVLHNLALKNGWLYKNRNHQVMDGKNEYGRRLAVTLQNHEFDYYPYLDTLKYLSWDGVLSDDVDSDEEHKYLDQTDGGYSGE